MSDVIRNEEEIQQMIDAIKTELDNLPDVNVWGDSNADEKRQMERDIQDLKYALRGGTPTSNLEVYYWLLGRESSTLGDYLW